VSFKKSQKEIKKDIPINPSVLIQFSIWHGGCSGAETGMTDDATG